MIRIPHDVHRYRKGYPGEKIDDPKLRANVQFYKNEIQSIPYGDFIDVMHKDWANKYDVLEYHHGYIQWLFPIHEEGMNWDAQILQRHEAETMRSTPEIMQRVWKSYQLILGFYGVKLKDPVTGELERAANFEERYTNLNQCPHNYLRITRVLKFLGEVHLEHLKLPFLTHFVHEVLVNNKIPNCKGSLIDYWLFTLRSDQDLKACLEYIRNPTTHPKPLSVLSPPPSAVAAFPTATHTTPLPSTADSTPAPAAADSAAARAAPAAESPTPAAETVSPAANIDAPAAEVAPPAAKKAAAGEGTGENPAAAADVGPAVLAAAAASRSDSGGGSDQNPAEGQSPTVSESGKMPEDFANSCTMGTD